MRKVKRVSCALKGMGGALFAYFDIINVITAQYPHNYEQNPYGQIYLTASAVDVQICWAVT